MQQKNLTVFIHYSWDSEEHKKWALFLASRLISDGLDVVFDQYDLKLGSNNNYFMEKIHKATKVILLMTPEYRVKADERKSGVGYEYQIITTELANNVVNNEKFIPILRRGARTSSIPAILQSYLYLDMTNDSLFESRYIELLRNIYGEPGIEKPQRGKKPNFRNLEKKVVSGEMINHGTAIDKVSNLGIARKQVQKLLGKPQRESILVETYWSHGIQVYYGARHGQVDGILAIRQPSGINYDGEIKGIKLGESFAEVKAKLGNPLNWGLPDPYTSFAFYEIDNNFLTIALWRNRPEGDSLEVKLGTVSGIGYSTKNSLIACEAIVAVSIEEIRAGKKISYLEMDESVKDINLSDSYFNEPYEMLPPQINNIGGGYFVQVVFKVSNKVILFWLYDLSWSYWTVRMITKPNDDSD